MMRPAFQFYPGDWLASADIACMTISEEGAYHRLLCHAWKQDDCGLPDDDGELAVLSKMGAVAWKKSANRIRRKFTAKDGRLFNERLLAERLKQEDWARKSANGGKMAHTKRLPKVNQKATKRLPDSALPVADCYTPNGYTSSSSSSSSLSSQLSTSVESSLSGERASARDFETALAEVAAAIHSRHPKPRRDASKNSVANLLRRIICSKLPEHDRLKMLDTINETHSGWCSTSQWADEGGRYAKGLEKWLASTKERWDVAPPLPFEATESPPIRFPSKREREDQEAEEELARLKQENKA